MEYELAYTSFKKSGKGYKIHFKNFNNEFKKIKLISPRMNVPFSIQSYKGKEIVSLEFTDLNKNNEMHNLFSSIKQIDRLMNRLSWDESAQKEIKLFIPPDLLQQIKGKTYISCIKEKTNFDPLIRVHLKREKKNIITEFFKLEITTTTTDAKKIPLTSSSINKSSTIATLELETLWITDRDYGLIWTLDSAQILT